MHIFLRMSSLRILAVNSRYLCISSTNSNVGRESRFMQKLMKRNVVVRDPLDFKPAEYHPLPKKKISVSSKPRVKVLNKIFMENITDLLSTGEIGHELLHKGIEISHVEVHSNFRMIDVFWMDRDVTTNPVTLELLKKCAIELRTELIYRRVIGNVPPIRFVECKGLKEMKILEEKFQQLTYGEDHMVSTYPNAMHHVVTVKTSNEEEKESDKNTNSNATNSYSVTLPLMRHNIFDLDHNKMMSKIKLALNKTKVKNQVRDMPASLASHASHALQNDSVFMSNKEQKEQFANFIKQRKKEQRMKCKKRTQQTIYETLAENDNYDDDDEDDKIDGVDENDDYLDDIYEQTEANIEDISENDYDEDNIEEKEYSDEDER